MTARDDILDLGKRIGQSVIGQETMVERLLLGLLANGHLLVEGLPGLAKTRSRPTDDDSSDSAAPGSISETGR